MTISKSRGDFPEARPKNHGTFREESSFRSGAVGMKAKSMKAPGIDDLISLKSTRWGVEIPHRAKAIAAR